MNEKLTQILNNILTIETCLLTRTLSLSDLILYIQYDIPLEESSDFYSKFSKSNHFKEQEYIIGNNERIIASRKLLNRIINYIYNIEKDGNKSTVVYKETIDFCKNMINVLNEKQKRINFVSKETIYDDGER